MIFTTSSSRTAARRSRWCARRCSARMAADRCSELLWALDRHPRAELDHGTVGQTEIFGGIAGARAHHHEQAFPPQRHALARRGHGGEAAEEIGHVIRVVVEAQPLMLVEQLQRARHIRPEEHTSELQSLMRISYAVFCSKKKKK